MITLLTSLLWGSSGAPYGSNRTLISLVSESSTQKPAEFTVRGRRELKTMTCPGEPEFSTGYSTDGSEAPLGHIHSALYPANSTEKKFCGLPPGGTYPDAASARKSHYVGKLMQIVRERDQLEFCDYAGTAEIPVYFLEADFQYMTLRTWSVSPVMKNK